MFPVCPLTACCSSHSQIPISGGLRSFSYWKTCDLKCTSMDWSYGFQLQSPSYKKGNPTGFRCSSIIEKCGRLGTTNTINTLYDQSSLNNINFDLVTVNDHQSNGTRLLKFVEKGHTLLNSSLDTIVPSVTSAVKGSFERVSGFSNVLKDASDNFSIVSIETFRGTVLVLEDALSKGATLVVYAYGSVKELLPSEIQNVLNFSEKTFHQAYVSLEALEKILGSDPGDLAVYMLLFLGSSAALWRTYLALTYGGYAGDLSPMATLQLLVGKDNAVLIDIRPEDVRERDGIPDLRRTARFRYTNITLPEVGGSIKKLCKSGSELENTLLAALIRDLKIVQDESNVIVMDDEGGRSKGIARSLRKLGLKRPYLMQGGFRSWIKDGLRIKKLKPETALTILNEEVEAILEEINPTPLKLLGYGVGSMAAVYVVLEWEKALQLVGFCGLFLTVYLRLSSYKDSEDIEQDVRLLLTPFRLGGKAIYWVIGKLGNNGGGLPTSPSSTEVQSRVMQAAAKHESQLSDSEDSQEQSSREMSSVNDSVNLP
ncbi:unnamed protein product [Cuscuta europaea]|uniref:Rhodanese domain-containing protein n=1 Tax=Cuscuta europaea TaxID=41803 RepID=A0A9P0ZJV8_CUSEU|nr:unnamed protein product [Cuscuta europaea]